MTNRCRQSAEAIGRWDRWQACAAQVIVGVWKQSPRVGMLRSSNSMTFELRTFLADSKFVEIFHIPSSNSNLRSTRSASHVYTHRPPVNLTLSEMLKVIVFVGCVNKSKFLSIGFSQHSFHYVKNVMMIGITFLHFIWYTVQYMSKLLRYGQICIRTDLCY